MRFRILVALLCVSSLNHPVHANDFVKVYEYKGIERSIRQLHDFRDRFLDFYRFKMANCMKARAFNKEDLYMCATHQMSWELREAQDMIQLPLMALNRFYHPEEEFILAHFEREFIETVRVFYTSWKQSIRTQVYHAF